MERNRSYRHFKRKVEMDKETSYLHELSHGISKEWAEGHFTDIEVVVEGQKFNCHRIILAAISRYFSVMFGPGFKEGSQRSVEINGIKGDAFGLVLEYIYTGRNIVSHDNVHNVLLSASMLQITSLQELCHEYLDKHLTIENCIGFWRLAVLHDIEKLKPVFWKFLIKRFPAVVNCMEFLTLSPLELEQIIKDDDLNTPTEEFACDMVMKWYRANKNVGADGLSMVIKHMKFELMDDKFLKEFFQKNPELEKMESVKSLVKTRMSAKHDERVLDSMYRKEEMVCMVGTRSRMPDPSKTEVQCYSYQDNKQFHLAPLPTEPGPCFAVCTLNNKIYISGGYNNTGLILEFDPVLNLWNQFNCILEGRWGHSMVVADGTIYLIGGISKSMETISSIEKFDPERRECTKVCDLPEPVSSIAAAVRGSKIYIIGGKNHDRQASALIQTYDFKENVAEVAGQLPPVCAGEVGKAVSFGSEMYIVYRDGNIILFNEDKSEIVGFTQKFEHYGVTVKDNNFLIIGCESNRFTTYLYEPTNQQVLNVPTDFKAPMCNFHLLKIVLSKKYLSHS